VERRVFRHREHPANLAKGLLGVNQVGNFHHARFVFQNPIPAGQAGVEDPVFDVARHLLRADQHTLDFFIVDRGKIRARINADFVAGAAKELQGGFL
jgi:hypothetical protein